MINVLHILCALLVSTMQQEVIWKIIFWKCKNLPPENLPFFIFWQSHKLSQSLTKFVFLTFKLCLYFSYNPRNSSYDMNFLYCIWMISLKTKSRTSFFTYRRPRTPLIRLSVCPSVRLSVCQSQNQSEGSNNRLVKAGARLQLFKSDSRICLDHRESCKYCPSSSLRLIY